MTNSPTAIARRLGRIRGVLRRRRLLRAFWWLRGPNGIDLSVESAPRWCEAFQELGPTFVKFGQLLSLREDLLPPEVTREFAKLQDRTAPLDFEALRTTVQEELRRPPAEVFASLDATPLAAASIAQVHPARLADGREVVVKVQRPGIRDSIGSDVAILQALAALVERAVPDARRYQPSAVVEEFRRSIMRELDFRAEARAMVRFAAHFAGSPEVAVPAVVRELSGPRLLVVERLDGRRITDVDGVSAEERVRLARALNGCYLTQIFVQGFFHADPHPGNVVVLADGRICFHDFGIVGRLSSTQQRALADLFQGVVRKDASRILEVFLRFGSYGEDVARDTLLGEAEELLGEYANLPIGEVTAAEMFDHLTRLARRYKVRFPTSFFLLGKTMLIVESVTRTLDPSYQVLSMLEDRAAELGKASWRGIATEARRIVDSSTDLVAALPIALSAVARKMREGTFDLKLRHEKLEELESRIDRSFNRLTFGVVVASIVVGSSIIMTTSMPPRIGGVPALGLFGFFIAAVLGLGLIVAIIRGGRM